MSPFILLTLRHPLEGMEGALFRSLLDIDCLNSLAEKSILPHNADVMSDFEDFHTPVLSLDDSIDLVRRTGLDPHLLSLLGLESAEAGLDTDQDGPYSDTDTDPIPLLPLEVESQTETILGLETATESDPETPVEPEEEQKEQELELPSEVSHFFFFCSLTSLKNTSIYLIKQGSHMSLKVFAKSLNRHNSLKVLEFKCIVGYFLLFFTWT